MNSCKNCTHKVFDEVWGEYKCKVLKRRIRDISKGCKHHNKQSEKGEHSNGKSQ